MFLLQMWDMRTLTLIKTYITKVPVIYVAMSPLLNHLCMNMLHEIQISISKINRSYDVYLVL